MSEFSRIIDKIKGGPIYGETFKESIEFNNHYARSFEFKKCIFEEEVSLINCGSIIFIDCEFKSKNNNFNSKNSSGNKVIEFIDCEINSAFIEEYSSLILSDCSIVSELKIGNVNTSVDIFNEVTEKYIAEIIFLSNNFISTLKFRNLNVGSLIFNQRGGGLVEVFGGKYSEIDLSKNVHSTKIVIGENKFSEYLQLERLSLNGISSEEGITVQNSIIQNIDFNNISYDITNKFEFKSVIFRGSVKIRNSNLKNCQFINIDFEDCELYLLESFITEATFSNITWPAKKLIYPDLTKNSKWWNFWSEDFSVRGLDNKKYNLQRESYRQLKALSLSNNNNIDALEFYKNEMRVYYPALKLSNGVSKADKFLLWLNRLVSNFGQSYTRPLFGLIICHYILYQFLVGFEFHFRIVDLKAGAGKYFELLNPAHKTPSDMIGIDYIIDFFMRVSAGFFIYHFLKATRKFGKVS